MFERIWGSRSRIDDRVVYVCVERVCRWGCGEELEVQQVELGLQRYIRAREYTGGIGWV
jgi:hypothetical protein